METTTFMSLLPMELNSISDNDLMEPPAPVERGEKVIADISNSLMLKKLFSLCSMKTRECLRLKNEIRFIPESDSSDYVSLKSQIHEYEEKGELVRGLFWIGLKDELGLWNRDGIGIRTGWKVVELPEHQRLFMRGGNLKPEDLRHLLGGFFGDSEGED
jgi:hypothetical protein